MTLSLIGQLGMLDKIVLDISTLSIITWNPPPPNFQWDNHPALAHIEQPTKKGHKDCFVLISTFRFFTFCINTKWSHPTTTVQNFKDNVLSNSARYYWSLLLMKSLKLNHNHLHYCQQGCKSGIIVRLFLCNSIRQLSYYISEGCSVMVLLKKQLILQTIYSQSRKYNKNIKMSNFDMLTKY